MALKSVYKGDKICIDVGDTIADLPAAAQTPIGSEFHDLATGNIWKNKQLTLTRAYVPIFSADAAMKITAAGSQTLAAGAKNIVTGVAVTANSKMIVQRTVPTGGGTALGLITAVRANGAAGVGNFQVSSISEAAGAIVAADVSTFDWMQIDPV